jgi:hypothetical protein
MVRGVMVLMKQVWIETIYKLLGNFDSIGCNNFVFPKENLTLTRINSSWVDSIQTDLMILHQVNLTMLWHQRMGHIEQKEFELCTKKVWLKVFLSEIWNSIFVNIAYMENKIELGSHLEQQGQRGF